MWALDFQHDQTADGRALRLLNVVDECTREALAMHVDRSITADETVAVLERLAAQRGAPAHIRCDNGTELTAHALRDWCRFATVATSYIDPGSPWQNPYVESFNGRVRDELLNGEEFSGLAEARVVISDWREDFRGRDDHCWPPPAQIPACASNALGSCLGFWRQSAREAMDAGSGLGVAIGR